MRIQVSANLRKGFGHILAPESEADVARLVINCARKQQDAGVANHFFAEGKDIALGLEVRKADGAAVGFHPFEPTRAVLHEGIEKAQIAQDDLQITLHENVTMAQSQSGEKFARGAAADGGVVLEFQAAPNDFWIAASEPSETQSGEAVCLAHGAEADAMFVRFAGSGKARGGVVLELAVDFV